MHGWWLILPIKISVGEVDNILTSHVVGNEVLIIYTYPNSPGSEHVYLEECHVVQSYKQKSKHQQSACPNVEVSLEPTIGLAWPRIAGSTIVDSKHVPILILQEVKH